nr:MAG: RNA-dependent RNA polymerase [Wufeng shrew rhabdovirus 6]
MFFDEGEFIGQSSSPNVEKMQLVMPATHIDSPILSLPKSAHIKRLIDELIKTLPTTPIHPNIDYDNVSMMTNLFSTAFSLLKHYPSLHDVPDISAELNSYIRVFTNDYLPLSYEHIWTEINNDHVIKSYRTACFYATALKTFLGKASIGIKCTQLLKRYPMFNVKHLKIGSAKKEPVILLKLHHSDKIPRLFIFLGSSISGFYQVDTQRMFVTTYNFMLSRLDLWESRYFLLVGNHFLRKINSERSMSTNTLLEFFNLGDTTIEVLGNDGFKSLKELESVLVAKSIRLADNANVNLDEGSFLMTMLDEFHKALSNSTLIQRWDQFLNSSLTHIQFLELSGLFRIWSHPIINPSNGMKKIKEIGRQEENIDQIFMEELRGDLIYTLLADYYNRHHRLPTGVEIPMLTTDDLYKYLDPLTKGYLPSPVHDPGFYLAFAQVKLPAAGKQELNFPDPLTLIDDKACALPLDTIMHNWAVGNHQYSTRVISEYLSIPRINLPEFLDKIDLNPLLLPENQRVVLLKPKEREMNVEGRMFAVMTFQMRMYTTATEYIVAKNVLNRFPEITMVDSFTDLHKTMMRLAPVYTGVEGSMTVAIHLDLSKWNTHQRYESTAPYFSVLDDWFGYNHLYKDFHKMIYHSKIGYLDGHKNAMPFSVPELTMLHHKGGIEGIRQKPWTIGGALCLRKLGRAIGLPFHMLLQGDNQILLIKIPLKSQPRTIDRNQEISVVRSMVKVWMNLLKEYTAKMGQHTKLEETWVAVNYLYYGKTPYVNGVLFSHVHKKVMRMSAATNDDDKSLQNVLGAITTTGIGIHQSLGDMFFSAGICWYLLAQTVWMFRDLSPMEELGWHDIIKKNNISIKRFVIECCTRPIALGGLGGLFPTLLEVRQFPDSLTQALTSTWTENNINNPLMKSILRTQQNPVLSHNKLSLLTIKRLIEAPDSLNLLSSDTYTGLIRDRVRSWLSQSIGIYINNEDLVNALIADRDETVGSLNAILAMDPMFPRLASFIYSILPAGMEEALINKFTTTRTLRREILNSMTKKLADDLKTASSKTWSVFIKHLSQEEVVVSCPTEHADKLRQLSWGSKLIGVTVPYPRSYLSRQDAVLNREERVLNDHFVVEYVDADPGPFTPYIGSATKEIKTTLSLSERDLHTPMQKQLMRLWELTGWFLEPTPDTLRAIESIYQGYGVTQKLFPYIRNNSGDPVHRFHSSRVSSGAFLSIPPHFARRCNINTSKMEITGRGGDNYVILFQACMVYITHNMVTNTKSPKHCVYQLSCKQCLLETGSVKIRLNMTVPYMLPAQHPKYQPDSLPANCSYNSNLQGFSEAVSNRLNLIKETIGDEEETSISASFHIITSMTLINAQSADLIPPIPGLLSVNLLNTIDDIFKATKTGMVYSCIGKMCRRNIDATLSNLTKIYKRSAKSTWWKQLVQMLPVTKHNGLFEDVAFVNHIGSMLQRSVLRVDKRDLLEELTILESINICALFPGIGTPYQWQHMVEIFKMSKMILGVNPEIELKAVDRTWASEVKLKSVTSIEGTGKFRKFIQPLPIVPLTTGVTEDRISLELASGPHDESSNAVSQALQLTPINGKIGGDLSARWVIDSKCEPDYTWSGAQALDQAPYPSYQMFAVTDLTLTKNHLILIVLSDVTWDTILKIPPRGDTDNVYLIIQSTLSVNVTRVTNTIPNLMQYGWYPESASRVGYLSTLTVLIRLTKDPKSFNGWPILNLPDRLGDQITWWSNQSKGGLSETVELLAKNSALIRKRSQSSMRRAWDMETYISATLSDIITVARRSAREKTNEDIQRILSYGIATLFFILTKGSDSKRRILDLVDYWKILYLPWKSLSPKTREKNIELHIHVPDFSFDNYTLITEDNYLRGLKECMPQLIDICNVDIDEASWTHLGDVALQFFPIILKFNQ